MPNWKVGSPETDEREDYYSGDAYEGTSAHRSIESIFRQTFTSSADSKIQRIILNKIQNAGNKIVSESIQVAFGILTSKQIKNLNIFLAVKGFKFVTDSNDKNQTTYTIQSPSYGKELLSVFHKIAPFTPEMKQAIARYYDDPKLNFADPIGFSKDISKMTLFDLAFNKSLESPVPAQEGKNTSAAIKKC